MHWRYFDNLSFFIANVPSPQAYRGAALFRGVFWGRAIGVADTPRGAPLSRCDTRLAVGALRAPTVMITTPSRRSPLRHWCIRLAVAAIALRYAPCRGRSSCTHGYACCASGKRWGCRQSVPPGGAKFGYSYTRKPGFPLSPDPARQPPPSPTNVRPGTPPPFRVQAA